MMLDQKLDGALLFGAHLNALGRRARELDRQARVIAAVGAFARVVKQQREAEQRQVLHFGKNSRRGGGARDLCWPRARLIFRW